MKAEKYHIEYLFENISLNSLWKEVSTPFGLSEWFADNVIEQDGSLSFTWHGTIQKAHVVFRRDGSVRFRWEDAPMSTFVEFDVTYDELTNIASLKITDFADPHEKDDAIMLWNTQIDKLRRVIGA